jgi:hypothetical protein
MIRNKFAHINIAKTLKNRNEYSYLFILFGTLNRSVIFSSINIIEQKMLALNYSRTLITKPKLVGVELLENMLKHQSKKASLKPYFELSIYDAELKFTTVNCVSEFDYELLSHKLKEYECLSHEGVKELYMKKLSSGKMDREGNAGLGILTVMKRTKKRYEYQIEKITENEYYFNSTFSLNRVS